MRLKILGIDYEVALFDAKGLPRFSCAGQFDSHQQKIFIRRGMPADVTEETITHEMLEALTWALGFELPHNQLSALAGGLHQVLKDNKPWIKRK
jgi:hypothetical protein